MLAADIKPDSFVLENATVFKGSRGLPGATHVTKTIEVRGIDAASPISISSPGQYKINGGSFRTSSTTVKKGDKIVVRLKASSTYDATVSTKLTIGGVYSSFSLPTIRSPTTTRTSLSGTTAFIYRDASLAKLRAFVYKPTNWSSSDRRPAMVCFFGGGWIDGDPSITVPRGVARWAATKGMVGITPDYRTNERFAATPLQSVDDSRAAVRWVQENYTSLGVDPNRIVVCGSSAGGHVGLWTAMTATPPGSNVETAPLGKPIAMVLLSSVVDTSRTGFRPYRFGSNATAFALSPRHQLEFAMPPALMFHGTADSTVPYAHAVSFCDALKNGGNECELVTLQGVGHSWFSTVELQTAALAKIEVFLRGLRIIK